MDYSARRMVNFIAPRMEHMIRELKIHFGPPAICGQAVRGTRNVTCQEAVTCRVCLYHLGLYVPLVKLREHQINQWVREVDQRSNTRNVGNAA